MRFKSSPGRTSGKPSIPSTSSPFTDEPPRFPLRRQLPRRIEVEGEVGPLADLDFEATLSGGLEVSLEAVGPKAKGRASGGRIRSAFVPDAPHPGR